MINPLVPAELVIDHSVQVDAFGTPRRVRAQRRARVRAQPGALRVPALGPGRVRQLRRRAAGHGHRAPGQPRVPRARRVRRRATSTVAYPDTLVGTDSHTTMINGLGVLGWGVGGIEAEAAMLGQPMSMLIPQVRRLQAARRAARGRDRDRPRADRHRDAARARRRRQVRRVLRPGPRDAAARRPRDDRQHEPGVRLDLRDLPDRRRDAALPASSRAARRSSIALVEAYAREQGLWHDEDSRRAGLLRHDRARPRRGRAVARRAEAPAGPRRAERRAGGVPDRRCRTTCRTTTTTTTTRRRHDRVRRRCRSRPPTRRRTRRAAASARPSTRPTPTTPRRSPPRARRATSTRASPIARRRHARPSSTTGTS